MALSSAPSAASAGRHARARKNASIRPRIDRSLPGYFEAQGRDAVCAPRHIRHTLRNHLVSAAGSEPPPRDLGLPGAAGSKLRDASVSPKGSEPRDLKRGDSNVMQWVIRAVELNGQLREGRAPFSK